MTDVIHMDDYRPHVIIPDIDGNAHVFPVSLIEDIIQGRRSTSDIEFWDKILPVILSEWLVNDGNTP